MKIDTLKQQAREHELAEEWEKALALYRRAVDALREAEDPDIALLNRMADLQIRSGDMQGAMESYDEAIELYLESDLPNNAIAICRKMLRNAPGRPGIFRRIGKIRAEQGFAVDARQSYLTYAEMMEAKGERDAAVEGLQEFISILPDDVETRLFLGRQYLARKEVAEGIPHLLHGWKVLRREGNEERAESLEEEIRNADPGAVFPDPEGDRAPAESAGDADDDGLFGFESTGLDSFNFGAPGDRVEAPSPDEIEAPDETEELDAFDFELDSDELDAGAPVTDPDDLSGELDLPASDELDDEAPFPPESEDMSDLSEEIWEAPSEVEADESEGVAGDDSLPAFELGPDEEDVPESTDPLPLITDDGEADVEEPVDAGDREDFEFGADVDESFEVDLDEMAEPAPDLESVEGVRAWIAEAPRDPDRHQALVELAYRTDDRGLLCDAFLGLAGALAESGEEEKARSVYEQVLQLDAGNRTARTALGRPPEEPVSPPPAAPAPSESDGDGGFVDLGSLILDEDDDETGTTRWVASGHEPSGDEGMDFAEMLSDFKSKVARNLDHEDARSQYDLGTAYREMGLVDEAIAMFQSALRAQPDNLGAIEMMGQCFLDKDEPRMAIRVLLRALDFQRPVEDDFLGIYYYLGEAHDRAGNPGEAREFYEKVFALDINFKDVTDRLRSLR